MASGVSSSTRAPVAVLRGRRAQRLTGHRARRQRRLDLCALFTGIVQGKATVVRAERSGGEQMRLVVAFPGNSCEDVAMGASISINGTCLTATHKETASSPVDNNGTLVHFDVVDETLRCTTLGDLAGGSEVNFERSARLGDEVGGHNVSGHVCCKATVSRVTRQADGNVCMRFTLQDEKWAKYLLPKGYVALNGCSLTIGESERDSETDAACFCVYLIPETLRVTVFGDLQEGDAVNVEVESQTQVIVDTVERVIAERLSRMNIDTRAEASSAA